jgi:predicted nucleic-acid-binding Zn-ribbon protein
MTISDVKKSLKTIPISKLAESVANGQIVSLEKAVALAGYKSAAAIKVRLKKGYIVAHCKCGQTIFFTRDQVELLKQTKYRWLKEGKV